MDLLQKSGQIFKQSVLTGQDFRLFKEKTHACCHLILIQYNQIQTLYSFLLPYIQLILSKESTFKEGGFLRLLKIY